MRRSAVWVAAAALVASLLPPAASAASTARHPSVGVQFHATWSDYDDAERIEVLDRLAAAGVRWVRVDVGWASFQEHGPDSLSQWYVDLVDEIVDAAAARGIDVLATLWLTPSWANGGAGKKAPPDDPADFGRVAGRVAGHFKGRIAAWEIWNEPNHPAYFEGNAADYAALLKAAYPKIKAADPAAKVVMGGPSSNDDVWLEKVYRNGAQGSFDVMATHPYQGMADAPPEHPDDGNIWWITHTPAVRDLMVRYGDADKEIWFTEFGWSSHENWPGVENWNRGVTEQQQADYLVRTLKFVGANYPYVTNVFWYNERNHDSGKAQLDNYGLLYRNLTPKPVYHALAEFLTSSASGSPNDPPASNLLVNGGFEDGTEGWDAPRGTLDSTSRARSGLRAGKVSAAGKVLKLRSGRIEPAPGSTLTAGGYVKASRAGQIVSVRLVERKDGRVVGYKKVRFRASAQGWEEIPTLDLRTTGGRIKLKLRAVDGPRLLADDLWVAAA